MAQTTQMAPTPSPTPHGPASSRQLPVIFGPSSIYPEWQKKCDLNHQPWDVAQIVGWIFLDLPCQTPQVRGSMLTFVVFSVQESTFGKEFHAQVEPPPRACRGPSRNITQSVQIYVIVSRGAMPRVGYPSLYLASQALRWLSDSVTTEPHRHAF